MYSPNSKYFQIPEVAILRPAKKAVPYTVIPIGNKEDLLRWRKDQALMAEAREAFLKPIREARRAKAVAMIENQNADTSLDALGKAEIAYQQVRKGVVANKAPEPSQSVMDYFKKPSVGAKVKEFFKDLWKSAFPD